MTEEGPNILDDNPDGLGKHIELSDGLNKNMQIYEGGNISNRKVAELHQIGSVPFFILRPQKIYLVIVNSDITCNAIKNFDLKLGDAYTLGQVSFIINDIGWTLKRAYKWLDWEEDELTILLIGKKE